MFVVKYTNWMLDNNNLCTGTDASDASVSYIKGDLKGPSPTGLACANSVFVDYHNGEDSGANLIAASSQTFTVFKDGALATMVTSFSMIVFAMAF